MYESKKSSGRKDIYKYQKSSYQRHFHNSTHFNHHKYTKYKQKYDYAYSPNDLDEELIFAKVFEDKNFQKRKSLKEIDEINNTPNQFESKLDNKENISMNSNINDEIGTRMKTNDENISSEKKETDNKKNNDVNINPYIRNDSEEILIEEKEEKNEKEIKDEILNEIKNLSNINNFNIINNNNENINININNINVENALNDFLNKSNEPLFCSNEKENIHIEYKKNLHKTPQPFKTLSSNSINLSSNDLKEAYYVPRKLSTIYDMYNTQKQPNFFERRHSSLNTFNFLTTIKKPSISLSNKENNNLNNINLSNNFMPFSFSGSNNLNNFKIPSTTNIPINSFSLFESNNININNIPNLSQCLNPNNNSRHNINKNPFHNMMPQFELNQCILKTQINNNTLFERDKENTDILEINVKISPDKTLTFKIRRYDDMFKTVKIFCEINKLDIKLIRPFIIYIIKALNSIYGIYNLKLRRDEIEFLKELKKRFYNDENNRGKNNEENSDEDKDDNDDFDEEEEEEDEDYENNNNNKFD